MARFGYHGAQTYTPPVACSSLPIPLIVGRARGVVKKNESPGG